VLDHKLEFDNANYEATLIDPKRDPASKMKPSTSFGNDIQTTLDVSNREC